MKAKRAAEKTRFDLTGAQLPREATQAQLKHLRAAAATLQESLEFERSAGGGAARPADDDSGF